MEFGGGEPNVVGHALDALSTALDHLVKVVEDGGLDGYDDAGLLGFARSFEQVRRRTGLVDHRLVRDLETRRIAETLAQPSTGALLAWLLRISRGEAGRRVRAGEQLGERVTMTGEPLPPLRPALADAVRAGDAGPEQVDICLRALGSVDHRGFDPADLEAAEGLLAQFATAFGPADLRPLAQQVVDRIDPDGTVPADQLNTERRHLGLRKTRDGMFTLEGRLTGAVGAKLHAVLSPLAVPRTETVILEDGREVSEPDPRHHGQRLHDALEEVCDRLLRSGTLPDSGGIPSTVIITIPEADLAARARWGVTADGTVLPADTVGRVADEAEVYPTVVSSRGVVLQLGRTRRLASCGQTVALIARDGGCSFPGCDRPPEWCERHHVIAWADGGSTDLDNLTLLCAYHHHNFAGRGWTCLMIDGLPAWTPPGWVDPHRRPLINTRISARQHQQRLRC